MTPCPKCNDPLYKFPEQDKLQVYAVYCPRCGFQEDRIRQGGEVVRADSRAYSTIVRIDHPIP